MRAIVHPDAPFATEGAAHDAGWAHMDCLCATEGVEPIEVRPVRENGNWHVRLKWAVPVKRGRRGSHKHRQTMIVVLVGRDSGDTDTRGSQGK